MDILVLAIAALMLLGGLASVMLTPRARTEVEEARSLKIGAVSGFVMGMLLIFSVIGD